MDGERPSIGYELKVIVREMLDCGQTYSKETSSFTVSLKIGDEEPIIGVVEGDIQICITVPDSLLEKIKSNL